MNGLCLWNSCCCSCICMASWFGDLWREPLSPRLLPSEFPGSSPAGVIFLCQVLQNKCPGAEDEISFLLEGNADTTWVQPRRSRSSCSGKWLGAKSTALIQVTITEGGAWIAILKDPDNNSSFPVFTLTCLEVEVGIMAEVDTSGHIIQKWKIFPPDGEQWLFWESSFYSVHPWQIC